jgi:hypothetical protein
MDKAAYLDFIVEIVRRSDDQQGLEVLPRRWVVERPFRWMMRWRRLVRDYERRIDVSHAMILVARGKYPPPKRPPMFAKRTLTNNVLCGVGRVDSGHVGPALLLGTAASVLYTQCGC